MVFKNAEDWKGCSNNNNNNFLTNNENTRSENEWGDLKCLFKACQAAITNGGFFTDTGVCERGEDEWQSENDN